MSPHRSQSYSFFAGIKQAIGYALLGSSLIFGSAQQAKAQEEYSLEARANTWVTQVDDHMGRGASANINGAYKDRSFSLEAQTDLDYTKSSLAYAQVQTPSVRIGGGYYEHNGSNWAAHVAYTPNVKFNGSKASLELGGDFGIFAGGLSSLDNQTPTPNVTWDKLSYNNASMYGASLNGYIELQVKPIQEIVFSTGATINTLSAFGRPTSESSALALGGLEQNVNPSLLYSLSEARLGGWVKSDIHLFNWKKRNKHVGGIVTQASYNADWVNLDMSNIAIKLFNPELADKHNIAMIPIRHTARAGLLFYHHTPSYKINIQGFVQQVYGSTTLEDFSQRNGLSVGGRIHAELGPIITSLQGMYSFDKDKLENLLGELPKFQWSAQVQVKLVDTKETRVLFECGYGQNTITDNIGWFKDSHMGFVGLKVEFGGPRYSPDQFDRFNPAINALQIRSPAYAYAPSPSESTAASGVSTTEGAKTKPLSINIFQKQFNQLPKTHTFSGNSFVPDKVSPKEVSLEPKVDSIKDSPNPMETKTEIENPMKIPLSSEDLTKLTTSITQKDITTLVKDAKGIGLEDFDKPETLEKLEKNPVIKKIKVVSPELYQLGLFFAANAKGGLENLTEHKDVFFVIGANPQQIDIGGVKRIGNQYMMVQTDFLRARDKAELTRDNGDTSVGGLPARAFANLKRTDLKLETFRDFNELGFYKATIYMNDRAKRVPKYQWASRHAILIRKFATGR